MKMLVTERKQLEKKNENVKEKWTKLKRKKKTLRNIPREAGNLYISV